MPINPIPGSGNPYSAPQSPEEKQELMKKFSSIKNLQPYQLGGNLMQMMFNKGGGGLKSLDISFAYSMPDVGELPEPEFNAAASDTPEEPPAAEEPAAGNQGSALYENNNLVNTDRLEVNLTDTPRTVNNTVEGPRGFSSRNNTVSINGGSNQVDLSGTPPAGVSMQTFIATGGANIENTDINITGDLNTVAFTGTRQSGNTININGMENTVNIGGGVDNASLNLSGSNIQVNMGSDDLLKKDQDNWTVNVSTSNIAVNIEDGAATVAGLNGNENFEVEIDEENRTVTVTELPSEE